MSLHLNVKDVDALVYYHNSCSMAIHGFNSSAIMVLARQ